MRDNPIFQEDLRVVLQNSAIPWESLRNKTVFVTGATGLIGYTLTCALLQYHLTAVGNVHIIALVRDRKKAEKKFADWLPEVQAALTFVEGMVESPPEIACAVDYIVHCACPTDSSYFIEYPVETVETIYRGTKQILEFARKKKVSGVVFLSSMEVYGEIRHRNKLKESALGYIDICSPRSSYPEGKRLAENLCCDYAQEYGIPVTIARLAQTFGPGVDRNDGRVFAYMARCALEGSDIRLNTDGSKENMYLYTMDAVSAILLLMIKGAPGVAYNVGNEATYCSIKEMAELVTEEIGGGKIRIEVNVGKESAEKYPPSSYYKLDISKIKALGWAAHINLRDMYNRMITEMVPSDLLEGKE